MTIYLHNYAEILAAVICTICFFYKPSVLNRWFIWFLWLTVVIEFIGKMTARYPSFKIPMYNIFSGVEFIFYFSLIIKLNYKASLKRILRLLLLLFIIFFALNLILFQGINIYNSNTYTVGCILLIIACLMQQFEFAFSDAEDYNALFWPFLCIISGLLIFYSGTLISTGIFNYMQEFQPLNGEYLYKLINNNLNVFLYISFSTAFLIEADKSRKGIIKNSTK